MTTKTANRKPTEIQSAAIFRCTSKENGEVFYLVNSDSHNGCYTVTWDEQGLAWRCNCDSRRPCKHERAVAEVENLRTQTAKRDAALAQAQAESADLLARLDAEVQVQIAAEQAQPDRPRSEQAQIADLDEPTWVRMADGSQRLPSQIDDPCLNSLSEMSKAYGEQKRTWTPAVTPISPAGTTQVIPLAPVAAKVREAKERQGAPVPPVLEPTYVGRKPRQQAPLHRQGFSLFR